MLSFVLLEEIHVVACRASMCGLSYRMGYWVVDEFLWSPHPLPTFEKRGLVWVGVDDVPQGDPSEAGHAVWVLH